LLERPRGTHHECVAGVGVAVERVSSRLTADLVTAMELLFNVDRLDRVTAEAPEE